MDDIVFEKDYSKAIEETPDSSRYDDILLDVISGSFLQRYSDALNTVPKVIISEYQANYDYVLKLCDNLAKKWNGKVRGVVSYEKWEASIDLVVPYMEFASPEELQILREIAEKSHGAVIHPADGGVHIQIYNQYFEDLISDEEKSYIAYRCILNDKELIEMLGSPAEQSPEHYRIAAYLNIFLDVEEKITGRDRTDILREFLFRVSSTDGAENIFDAMKKVAREMIDESGLQ